MFHLKVTSVGSNQGEIAPTPMQPTWPEVQSPVVQVNLPESPEHPVRAQILPDQGDGTSKELDVSGASSKLVVDN